VRPAAISRRAVLGLALAGSLTGCGVRWVGSPETTPTVQRGPDDDARDAAVADTRAVAALALVPPGAPAAVAAAVTAVATATAAHRRALGDDPGPAPVATPGGTAPTAGETPAVADVPALLALLARTATGGLAAVAGLGAGTARLLVSVAVSRAVLLDGLAAAAGVPAPAVAVPAADVTTTAATPTAGATPRPAGSASRAAVEPGAVALAALQRALAGEHEAVYAYGLVSGRAAVQRQPEALADLAAHRVARDRLDDALRAVGADPVAAAAGYEAAAATPADAAALAAAVEERLAAVYEDVVGSDPARRALAAAAVLRAARAGVRWGSTVRSFPGLPALAEDGRPAAAPAVSPTGAPTAAS